MLLRRGFCEEEEEEKEEKGRDPNGVFIPLLTQPSNGVVGIAEEGGEEVDGVKEERWDGLPGVRKGPGPTVLGNALLASALMTSLDCLD